MIKKFISNICFYFLVAASSTFASELATNVNADGWISHPEVSADKNPVVLHFRREFDLAKRPKQFLVNVTADNRYVLFVNGKRAAAGPSTGDIDHWRVRQLDLAPYLKAKQNVIAAVVWNGVKPIKYPASASEKQIRALQGAALFNQTAPNFQQSVATGFRLIGESAAELVSTSLPGWRVQWDKGHSFTNGWRQVRSWYYVAGHPEIIDANNSDPNWTAEKEQATNWVNAIAAPQAAQRRLVNDKLPAQTFAAVAPGKVVRSELKAAFSFPKRSVTIAANSKVKILLQRDAMVSAYPQLDVAGGTGSVLRVTYSEALYDKQRKKADRNLIEDRTLVGPMDMFTADGSERTFETLWWRTWRYMEIEVETKDQPLTLKSFRAFETGYPFKQVASFSSDDAELNKIFDIGWRTAKLDAHETYMDTAFWEQLQYTGDTRLQMLISYVVSGDPRLAEQAIDAFASSNLENGLMDGAYPSRSPNVIAPFSLLWVGMLSDWHDYQPNPAPVIRHLGRMREVLDWFAQWQLPNGLLGKNPQWNFIDWVGQPATDRAKFPSYGKNGGSCLMSLNWLGALQQGARLEKAFGDVTIASKYSARAEHLASAIKTQCWSSDRGLFADNPDLDAFSQHANALAIIYGLADKPLARQILGKIVIPGKGIDAPEGMFTTSYYFSWYLVRAYLAAGLNDQYVNLLQTWRDLLKLNYTTWPEERGDTRSDSHAWSAHPTPDLVEIVAGIRPAEPGYTSLLIAPALGSLHKLDASAATPLGKVVVSYRVKGNKLKVKIEKPALLPGVFIWGEQQYQLDDKLTRLTLEI
jgi:alpha-L-rhamnosidase